MAFVFVYGSLLRGEDNHELLNGCRCHGDAKTDEAFTLYDLGPYPGMVAGGRHRIVGELYDVGEIALAALDAFEGHPTLFCRTGIDASLVEAEGGRRCIAYSYLLVTPPRDARVIVSGSFRAYRPRGAQP